MKLEDERHEFQLTTLLALQELTRRMARATVLIIDRDHKTVAELGGYRRLPADDPDDFANAVNFAHNVARVTNGELRVVLDEFHRLTSEYSLPPYNHRDLSRDEMLAIQDTRWRVFAEVADHATRTLNEHLRKEIDRAAVHERPREPEREAA